MVRRVYRNLVSGDLLRMTDANASNKSPVKAGLFVELRWRNAIPFFRAIRGPWDAAIFP
jgi:hypothetical protein